MIFLGPFYSPTWGHVYLGPAVLSIAGEARGVCWKSELEGGGRVG